MGRGPGLLTSKTPKANLPKTLIAAKAIADYNRTRIKSEKERGEKLRLENQITRTEYLSRKDLAKGLATVADAMSSRIMSSDLSRPLKEELLKDIAAMPLVLEEVAHAQSRFTIAKKKKAATEEADSNDEETA